MKKMSPEELDKAVHNKKDLESMMSRRRLMKILNQKKAMQVNP